MVIYSILKEKYNVKNSVYIWFYKVTLFILSAKMAGISLLVIKYSGSFMLNVYFTLILILSYVHLHITMLSIFGKKEVQA